MLYFENPDTFTDYVHQHAGRDSRTEHVLHLCRRADGTPAYLLETELPIVGYPSARQIGRSEDLVRIERNGTQEELVLEGIRKTKRLPTLMGPVPADVEAQTILVMTSDAEVLAELVSHFFRLECDRLKLATVEDRRQRVVHLCQVDRPSHFVLQEALEHPEVRVLLPTASSQVFVPFGSRHPLDTMWQPLPDGLWLYTSMGPGARTVWVSTPEWSDIYEQTTFALTGRMADETLAPGAQPPPRFVIELHLEEAYTSREPQLWVLGADGHTHLERLLKEIPEADLHAIHFAPCTDARGEVYLILRERIAGQGRSYLTFGGIRLAPFAGFAHLMLSADHTLEPPLRKDRYHSIFGLRPGELTLVWPSDDKVRVVSLQESYFRPLSEYVDYVTGAAHEALGKIIHESVFHFQRYERAPRRPAMAPASAPVSGGSTPAHFPRLEPKTPVKPKASDAPEPLPAPTPAQPQAPTEEALSELTRREVELETQLVLDGQSVTLWRSLSDVKLLRGRHDDAILCLKEALFLAFGEGHDDAAMVRQLIELIERSPSMGLQGRARAEVRQKARESDGVDWLWLDVLYHTLDSPTEPATRREWLSHVYARLAHHQALLRLKEQWLLWARVLRAIDDAITETKVRERLLEDLTQNGLRPTETPAFVRERIYASRFIDGSEDGDDDAYHALTLVETIEREVTQAEDIVLTRVGSALLSYGFERLGMRAQSERYQTQASDYLGTSQSGLRPIEKAWVALYLAAANQLRYPERKTNPYLDQYNGFMAQHNAADLARGELEALQRGIFLRSSADKVTEFFSAENFRTFYSSVGNYDGAEAIRSRLEHAVNAGHFDDAMAILTDLANNVERGTSGLDARPLSWLLTYVVDALRRCGRSAEGTQVLSTLEAGLHHIPRPMNGLYNMLLHIKIAEGYIELGHEARGLKIVTSIVRTAWRQRALQWLDHLDMLGTALQVIELASVSAREDALRTVLGALHLTDTRDDDKHYYRPIKLRLLDHCIEVAMSREKLSLKRFRNYVDDDEFYVRSRIVNERIVE